MSNGQICANNGEEPLEANKHFAEILTAENSGCETIH